MDRRRLLSLLGTTTGPVAGRTVAQTPTGRGVSSPALNGDTAETDEASTEPITAARDADRIATAAARSTRSVDGVPPVELVVDDLPAAIPLSYAVSGRMLSENGPAAIDIAVTNRSRTTRTIRTAHYPLPFPVPYAESAAGNRFVLSTDRPATEPCPQREIEWHHVEDQRSITPGGTLSRTYYATNDADGTGCWAPGTYRFSCGYLIDDTDADFEGFEWGFDIVVRE
ncbi:hypothetical protein ACNS7O_01745 [Haloferacaceae archaeon DSL9]